MKKLLFFLFAFLIFFVPLILWPYTSEVFEFNKMVLVYALTTLIVGAWISRSIIERKIIFRRTILDIPLLVFLASQIISTILSIDPQTSLLGFYSRFNGGLFSTICYSLLYWSFVSNFDVKDTLKLIKVWLVTASLVSIIAFGEHFSFFAVCAPIQYSQIHSKNADPALVKKYNSFSFSDKFNYIFRTSCWVQDVQIRVFSTLGQPNWLAAWLVALLPLTWFELLKTKFEKKNVRFWLFFGGSILFTWTLIFTKSRSGILGFFVAILIFGLLTLKKEFSKIKGLIIPVSLVGISILFIGLVSGTPWTPSISQYFNKDRALPAEASAQAGPALETGGTESGVIRQIVWKGALQVFLNYPIFGSGVETFAFSYPKFRPVEHNLVSEWDFIYNKAHNEYLNLAANSGGFGLLSYLILVGTSIFMMIKNLQFSNSNFQSISNSMKIDNWQLIIVALTAGYVSILVTNFFGFSVVPTQLELFLFPAMAIAIDQKSPTENKDEKSPSDQKFTIFLVLIPFIFVLIAIFNYWYADTLYMHGKSNNSNKRPDLATKYLQNAIDLEPNQSLYHNEIANSYTGLALAAFSQKNATQAAQLASQAISESQKSIDLSPNNPNLKRSRFGIFIMLSSLNPNYLILARDTLTDAINYAPTDAKLYYNLALVYARTGDTTNAIKVIQKTIELKANYKEARLAYAFLLIDMSQKTDKKQTKEAKVQLEYILDKIDPNDSLTKQTLESIK